MRHKIPMDERLALNRNKNGRQVRDLTPCWEWTGKTDKNGYARITVQTPAGPRGVFVHRIAYELSNGPLPDGLWVLHQCDNPSCSNPDHLFLGDNAANQQDCARKGRRGRTGARCERHPSAKLTNDQVREIRGLHAAGARLRDLTYTYGLTKGHMWKVVHGVHWKEV